MLWFWIAAWLVAAVGVTLIVGYSIRLADRRAAQARQVPNFIAQVDSLPTPRPTDEVQSPAHRSADGPARRRRRS